MSDILVDTRHTRVNSMLNDISDSYSERTQTSVMEVFCENS